MRSKFLAPIRCFVVLSAAVLCGLIGPNVALAQSGVDDSSSTGVFQMEGDAQRTATICFLPVASGGPAIASPIAPGTNKTDGNGCPTVSPSGTSVAWTLVNYGSNTDDWSSFAFSNGAFTSRSHALFDPAFVTDPVNSGADNTFLGASSKDTQDISQWNWNPHGVQDKDDIEHAGAGAYHLNNGDTVIYAFMDRYSNNGDSTAGFWFVQDSTFALCTGPGKAATGNGGTVNNPNCTASGTFVGHHTVGDILIVSDFSIGGAVSTINIFEWNGSTIVLTKTISPAPCMPDVGGDDFCGAVNNAFTQVLATKGKSAGQPVLVAANVTAGWPFSEKTQGATSFVTGEFLEIAVDLNKIFQGNLPCFSTFFSETRSSTSLTATLSDLTVPVSFPLCSLTASKKCDTASIVNGNQVQYNFSGDITNTGSNTLYSPVIYDTPPTSTVTGSLTITGPTGPIPGNSSTNGHYTGSFVSSSILSTTDLNRISAAASSNSGGTPLNVVCGTNPPAADGSNECADWGSACSPPLVTGLTVSKLCNTCLVGGTDLHVQVNEAFKVCNTGNVSVSAITVKDCEGGNYSSGSCSGTEVTVGSNITLGPATFDSLGNLVTATCSTVINHTYTPTSTGACTGNTCSLHDEAKASGTAALVGTTINSMAVGADCPVCPINTSCTSPTL